MINENIEEEKPMLFMGVDPGIFTTTVVVLDSQCNFKAWHQVYYSENDFPRTLVENRKKGQRVHDPIIEQIAADHVAFMTALIDMYKPEAIACEKMDWSTNYSNTQGWVHHCRGILHSISIQKRVPFTMITPQTIKKAATGNGNAQKQDVAREIYRRYSSHIPSISWLNKNNHVADATGAALFLVRETMGYLDTESEDM
jgi:Holliday junction resolvasome RuvABC endonuclease subunit